MRRHLIIGLLLGTWLGLIPALARCDDQGQADLDKAMELKLSNPKPTDWEEIIRLSRGALAAGLDETNQTIAKGLLGSTLAQRGEALCNALFEQHVPADNIPTLREKALSDLSESLELNPQQPETWYLVARLNAMPGGDPDKVKGAIDKVIEFAGDDPLLKAKSLLVRASLSHDETAQTADFDEAVKLAPKLPDAYRSRGVFHFTNRRFEEAEKDLRTAVELNPKLGESHEALGVVLLIEEKMDEALKEIDEALRLQPTLLSAYLRRAQIYAAKNDARSAMMNVEMVLRLDPDNVVALLMRARMLLGLNQGPRAMVDVEHALRIQPKNPEAILIHGTLLAGQRKFKEAAAELEQIKALAPKNAELLNQLGLVLTAAKELDRAVATFGEVLEFDATNVMALRSRGDAYLGLGRQLDAIKDYEAAIKVNPDDSGLLNNLAWVLATSPEDTLRDGKRATELATHACEVTEFKLPHILSTLAASYAESGDFDKAVEWSRKAVEIGTGPQKKHLEQELESYLAKKPWREARTEIEEDEADASGDAAMESSSTDDDGDDLN